MGDSRIHEIQSLYESTHTAIRQARNRIWKILGISFGALFAIFFLIMAIALTSIANDEKNELARLEKIEMQLQDALEAADYTLALMHADRLRYGENDDKHIRDWQIKREYWIKRVVEEAAKHGIILEPPVDPDTSEGTISKETP